MNLDDLAVLLTPSSEDRRWLLLAEFLTEFGFEDPTTRQALLASAPRSTGSKEWDALLGALAEHLAFHDGNEISGWVDDPERFLDAFWFPSNTPAARGDALVHAPASFLRRGDGGAEEPSASVNDAPLLDKGTILKAFSRLSTRLQQLRIVVDVYLFGGGAMVFAFDEREATQDLDARFTSTSAAIAELRAVAQELGLPSWWLNEQGTT